MTDVFEWDKWHSLVFNFSQFPNLLCIFQSCLMSNHYEGKDTQQEQEMGQDPACWDASMARLFYVPYTWMDRRPAGRPTCCSCPGNIQQWSKGIHRHWLNLSFTSTPTLISSPPSFVRFLFILHFLLSFTPSLEQNLTTSMLLMSWLPQRQKLHSNKAVQRGWVQGIR